jgi:Ca-activated chloride channel family protein
MTHDHDTTNGPAEELLTAYALGECTAAERAAVERLLADDVAAVRRIDDVRQIADMLKTAAESELPARSPDLRRAVIAAAAHGTVTSPAARPGGWGRLVWAVAGLTAVAAAVVVSFPPALHLAGTPRQMARREATVARNQRAAAVETESIKWSPSDEQVSLATSMPTGSTRPQLPAGDRLARHRQWGFTLEAAAHPAPAIAATRQGPLAGIVAAPGDDLFLHEPAEESGQQLDAARRIDRERYDKFAENRVLRTAAAPLSTFSIDVDTASYANVRRFLAAGRRPPRDAVRIEELVNYFRYARPRPEGDDPFAVTVEAAECPWRPGHRLVRVALAGRDVARDARPAGNLVFLVDVSGSMGDPDKFPLVKQALLMLVDELTENDRVAIVTYAGDAGLKLPPTSGDQKGRIRTAIESLTSGGSTHGSAGIELAYEQAAERFIPGGANRVILATDGDLNVGVTDDAALVELIQARAKGGTFLTVLGFGQGNLQDEKMEKLADNGNGVYAYIDGVREARKVLVEQLTGSTITIAKDVKIQVEFNPAVVSSYRLLGYENRALADADFRDDRKDAGEIGAGHGVTALYEVALVGDRAPAEGRGAEPLKYRRDEPQPPARDDTELDEATSRELLTVKLRFKQPEGDVSRLLEVPLTAAGGAFDAASTDLRFAAAVAAFGMILRGSEHIGDATLPMVARIAGSALGDDPGGYRAEFLDLVRRAESAR